MQLSKELNDLYPDLAAAGGLADALQAALREIGSALTVSELDPSINFIVYARVQSGDRFSQVYIGAEQRMFSFDFWVRGVMLAQAGTPDLGETARAIDTWVGSDCGTADLAGAFDFVDVQANAFAFERGEEVEDRWQSYLKSVGFPELEAFVAAASRRPQLRQLFPFTSLNTFCFSRCTGYPFTRDTPRVRPLQEGEYEVVSPSGAVLGRGNAEEAAELVVANLPDCGPAVPGTAVDLLT